VANSGWRCKELIRGAVICVITAACFFAAFVVLALFVPQDQQAIRRHIVSAIEEGTFKQQHWYGPFGAIIWPRHTLDCVLAGMMLAPPAGRMTDALSNQHILPNLAWRDTRVAETLDCQSMVRAVSELGEGYGAVQFERTDRYILGVRVLGKVLLGLMPFDAMAQFIRAIAFALLAVLGLLSFARLRSAIRGGEPVLRPAAYLIITACLTLLYGVHYFDATLYFAPLDYTHFAFTIISLLVPLARMRLAGLAFYAASYGSLIAIFESLSGGIPFALAMLPLLLALGFEGERREYFWRLFVLWGGFCIAVVTCFALKKGVAVAFLGDEESFLSLLFYRMQGAPLEESGTKLTLGYLLSAYRHWSRLIAFGSSHLGTALVLAALGVIAAESWRSRNTGASVILLACWLGIAALLIWSAAFLNHTAVHPYFMARLLVIPVIGALVLVAGRALSRSA
jgi:hypothetical protein